MFILTRRLIVSTLLALSLLWPGSAAGRYRETATVLYAHDATAIYMVNPNNGMLTLINYVQKPPDLNGGLSLSSMVYHARQRKLYAFANFGPDGPATEQVFLEIDPHTVQAKTIARGFAWDASFRLSYDWKSGVMYCISPNNQTGIVLTIDPKTGNLSRASFRTRGADGGASEQIIACDTKGDLWVTTIDKYPGEIHWWFNIDQIRISDQAELRHFFFEVTATPFSDPEPRNRPPMYGPETFNPITNIPYMRVLEEVDRVWYSSLWTMDVNTGKPAKKIADGFWLGITWGFGQ